MLNKQQARRLTYIIILLIAITIGVGLVLYSLKQNINLFFTPTQALAQRLPAGHTFRLGGQVKRGSLIREKNNLTIRFILTDVQHEIMVTYTGILPDLFKEGNGAIAEGQWNANNEYIATQILAKHDENYSPKAMAGIGKE
jgi:cytochrome c-type biogenesis protein CcmE